MPHISLAAERLWLIGGFPVTNSLLTTWLVMVILAGLAFVVGRGLRFIPTPTQAIAEIIIGGLHDFFRSVTGKHVNLFFPLLASLFLFIIVSNWVGLLPGVGTVGFFKTHVVEPKTESAEGSTQKEMPIEEERYEDVLVSPETQNVRVLEEKEIEEEKAEFVPLLRGPTADLNTTLGLALVAVFAIQYFGFKTVGTHYSTRFLNFKNPIYFVVGILEIVSEISKVVSFAFRLFGNMFAGEVLLTVIAFLMPFLVPLPFLMLELFVGFIQALVFSMLTAVFLNVAVSHAEEHH